MKPVFYHVTSQKKITVVQIKWITMWTSPIIQSVDVLQERNELLWKNGFYYILELYILCLEFMVNYITNNPIQRLESFYLTQGQQVKYFLFRNHTMNNQAF